MQIGSSVVVTYGQIMDAVQVVKDVARIPMEPRSAYWMDRNFESMKKLIGEIDKQRMVLVKKYGVPDARGINNVTPTILEGEKEVPNPKWDEFVAELQKYLAIETTIMVNKVPLWAFSSLTPMLAGALCWMIDVDAVRPDESKIIRKLN